MSTSLPVRLSRGEVLEAMRSANLDPPDLDHLFEHWPRGISPHYEEIKKEVDAYLQSVVSAREKREKYIEADYGWLFASWFPYAPLEGLKTLSKANVWLFLWDDEIDINTGPMWDKWEVAEEFRQDTKDFIRACLGLADDQSNPYDITKDIRIASGGQFLESIREQYSIFQRKMYFQETEKYIDYQAIEQRVRLSNSVPTIEEFYAVRPASSGSSQEMCYLPLAYDYAILELPEETLEDSDFKMCWDNCVKLVAYINDVWSVRKEIKEGAIDSLIPLFYAQERDMEAAWRLTVDLIGHLIMEFDESKESLLCRYADRPELKSLEDFLRGCQYICTGNLLWSKHTPRYNKPDALALN